MQRPPQRLATTHRREQRPVAQRRHPQALAAGQAHRTMVRDRPLADNFQRRAAAGQGHPRAVGGDLQGRAKHPDFKGRRRLVIADQPIGQA